MLALSQKFPKTQPAKALKIAKTPLSFDAPPQGTPANICINLIPPETTFFVADTVVLSSFRFSWYVPKDACFVQ